MRERRPCGRAIYTAPAGVDKIPVCLMHSRNPNKDDTAFQSELEEVLRQSGRGIADLTGFVFPSSNYTKRTFDARCVFDEAAFLATADFRGAVFRQLARFRRVVFSHGALLVGTAFEADADFMEATFVEGADFRGCIFAGAAVFSAARFLKISFFSGAKFGATAQFADAAFNGHALFNEGIFQAVAYFNNVVFREYAVFKLAKFIGPANFIGARFTQTAEFRLVRFTQPVSFEKVEFGHVAEFDDAQFEDAVNLKQTIFSEEAHFIRTRFMVGTDFQDAMFVLDADFRDATFEGDASFLLATFRKGADFSGGSFTQEANFSRASFHGAVEFHQTQFRRAGGRQPGPAFARARFERPEDTIFADTYLGEALFYRCDVSKLGFSNVHWRRRENRKAVAFEEVVDLSHQAAGFGLRPDPSSPDERNYIVIAELYQQLKKNYDDRRDYWTAGDFHYGEMEMKRLSSPRRNKVLRWLHRNLGLVAWYKYASEYGENYVLPVLWLVVLLLAFALVYPLAGLTPGATVGHIAAASFEQGSGQVGLAEAYAGPGIMTTVGVAFFQRDLAYAPSYPWGRLVSWLQLLLTYTLVALFLLAVRRQFRR